MQLRAREYPLVGVGGGVAAGSSLLESYGQPGAGQWITVYGSQGHAFIEVAGIVLDTAHYAPVQPASVPDRSRPAIRPTAGPQPVRGGSRRRSSRPGFKTATCGQPATPQGCDAPSDPPCHRNRRRAGRMWKQHPHALERLAGSVDTRIVNVGDSERNKDEPARPGVTVPVASRQDVHRRLRALSRRQSELSWPEPALPLLDRRASSGDASSGASRLPRAEPEAANEASR